MMMMMMSKSPEDLRIDSISNDPLTISTVCPTWKLYENPFYTNNRTAPQYPSQNQIHQAHHSEGNKSCDHKGNQIHRLQLPISTRKIAASFWDLTFIRPFMESEIELARAKILELKEELEQERKARKRAESMNKKLVRELLEARKGGESLEWLCEELAREISSGKAEMDRMNKDMDEERKMLRMAEVLREERVQMKLADAKLLLEEKLYMCGLELEGSKCCKTEAMSETVVGGIPNVKDGKQTKTASNGDTGTSSNHNHQSSASGDDMKSARSNDRNSSNIGFGYIPSSSASGNQRRASPEPENPHIKRGIKGFVEFPKVVRAMGSKSRHLGTKLECQKGQIRILLKQKSPIRSTPPTLLPAN